MILTAKAQEKLNASTILITGVDSPIIRCKAREAFNANGVHVARGDQFFLVRSSKDATRYYVVSFSNTRHDWQCSCGAGLKPHAHTQTVKAWIVEHVVIKERTVSAPVPTIKPLPRASEVVHKPISSTVQPDVVRGNLNGQRGFSLMR